MKANVAVLTAAALLGLACGCSESPRNANGAYVSERTGTNEWVVTINNYGNNRYFQYVEVDGHEYLMMIGTGGLSHSPRCGCRKHLVLEYPEDWRDNKPETNAIPIPLEHHKPRPCGRLARPSEFR